MPVANDATVRSTLLSAGNCCINYSPSPNGAGKIHIRPAHIQVKKILGEANSSQLHTIVQCPSIAYVHLVRSEQSICIRSIAPPFSTFLPTVNEVVMAVVRERILFSLSICALVRSSEWQKAGRV